MPRQLKQFEVDGVYHLVSRGVEKRKIFMKPQDYSRFILGLEFFNRQDVPNDLWNLIVRSVGGSDPPILERLKQERQKPSSPLAEILALALMPNHFHLIVREIIQGGISAFMQKMGGYTTYFNKQYDRVGPLFQRYKSVPIKNDVQLGNVFVYVHTNPIEIIEPEWKSMAVKNKARAMRWLESYPYSSYPDYTGKPRFEKVIKNKFFIEFFGNKNNCHQAVNDWVEFKAQNTELGPEIIE